jgi:dipeptidase E
MGGAPDETLLEYVLDLAPGRRLLYVPTAGMESPDRTVWWYERLRGRGEMTHLHFFPWPPSGLRELTLDHDVILVTGGNTANALAIWRAHGFDEILREAWQQGVLLAGWSAGKISWIEHGVTYSFGPQLDPM